MSRRNKNKKKMRVYISINQVIIDEKKQSDALVNADHKNSKIKQWLIDNKIYFETWVSVCLTFAGIFVSVATFFQSCQVANDEAMLNMPLFNIKQEVVHDPNIEGAIEGVYGDFDKYTIMNQGGGLTNGEVEGIRLLNIAFIDPLDYSKKIEYTFEIDGQFLSTYSQYSYDPDNRTFTLYSKQNNYALSRIIDKIEERLIEEYPYKITITYFDCAKITFCDFRGDAHILWYDLVDGSSIEYVDVKTDGYISELYLGDFDMIYDRIKNVIDEKIAQ